MGVTVVAIWTNEAFPIDQHEEMLQRTLICLCLKVKPSVLHLFGKIHERTFMRGPVALVQNAKPLLRRFIRFFCIHGFFKFRGNLFFNVAKFFKAQVHCYWKKCNSQCSFTFHNDGM